MRTYNFIAFLIACFFYMQIAENTAAQDDVADVPSEELQVGKNENMQYFLIGAEKGEKGPSKGYGLVVIMPGGGGGRDFHAFVKRIYKNALPGGYLVAQPIAIKWTPAQVIVWPVKKNPVTKMEFTTEEFVEAVIKDVKKKHRIDKKRVFTLSWSSSGPAAYAISLQDKTAVKGAYIAMSVFKPDYLPSLKNARGRAFFIDHSPEDTMCPYAHAEDAVKKLKKAKAKVTLETYEGGHGWHGNIYGRIQKGIKWLEKNAK